MALSQVSSQNNSARGLIRPSISRKKYARPQKTVALTTRRLKEADAPRPGSRRLAPQTIRGVAPPKQPPDCIGDVFTGVLQAETCAAPPKEIVGPASRTLRQPETINGSPLPRLARCCVKGARYCGGRRARSPQPRRLGDYVPKPKWMRWPTYERKLGRIRRMAAIAIERYASPAHVARRVPPECRPHRSVAVELGAIALTACWRGSRPG